MNEGKQRRDPALLHDDFATGLQSGETREKRDAELLDVERNVLDANEFEDDGDDVEGIKQTTDVDWRSGRNKRERAVLSLQARMRKLRRETSASEVIEMN